MSVLLNPRLVDSLVAPRREQSGAKNIPREAPLRHFLSGVFFFLFFFFRSIPARYPRAYIARSVYRRCCSRFIDLFRSISAVQRSLRDQQCDSGNISSLRSADQHLRSSSSFTYHRSQSKSYSPTRRHYSSSGRAKTKTSSPPYIGDR